MRAGALVTGETKCLQAIAGGQALLVLVDGGASENTRKMYLDACNHRDIPMMLLPGGALGRAIGREERMSAAVTSRRWNEALTARLNEDFPDEWVHEPRGS